MGRGARGKQTFSTVGLSKMEDVRVAFGNEVGTGSRAALPLGTSLTGTGAHAPGLESRDGLTLRVEQLGPGHEDRTRP